MSHNLLKAGAKRRRTKGEIMEAKEAEAGRLREIAYKVEQFSQMEIRFNELQQQSESLEKAQSIIENLKKNGLLKQTGSDNYNVPTTWGEVYANQQEIKEEKKLNEEMSQQN